MKFIHTADWQIGMKAAALGDVGARVREERLAAGRRVIETAKNYDRHYSSAISSKTKQTPSIGYSLKGRGHSRRFSWTRVHHSWQPQSPHTGLCGNIRRGSLLRIFTFYAKKLLSTFQAVFSTRALCLRRIPAAIPPRG